MYAQRWVDKYSEAPIKRILLFPFSPIEIEGYMLERGIISKPTPMIYAVVFEVDTESKEIGMTPEEQMEWDFKKIRGERPLESYERLLAATKPNRRLSDNEQYHDLMTADFVKIYKLPEKGNHPEKWEFIVKFKNSELNANIRTDEPCVVLWPNNQQVSEQTDSPNKQDSILEINEPSRDIGENYFVRYGEFWKVGFAGETTTLRDLKRVRYVIYLLENKQVEFYPTELQQKVENVNIDLISKVYSEMKNERREEEEHLHLTTIPIDGLSDDEKESFEEQIYKIWKPGIDESNKEWKNLINHLKNEYGIIVWSTPKGLKYKHRYRLDADNARARKTITKNIKNFRDSIKKEMPKLKEHLDQYLKTGNKFSYSPDRENPIPLHISC